MRKPIKVAWTKEIDKLKQLLEVEKRSLEEVSKLYDMPTDQVRVVCIRLGIKYTKTVFPWTKDEIDIVRESLLLEETYEEISKKLPGRTKEAVRALYEYHKEEHNLVKPNPRKLVITETDINSVKELVSKGYPDTRISDILKLTINTVKKIKSENNLKQPSKKELENRGIFLVKDSNGNTEIKETTLTYDTLCSLLDNGESILKIARDFELSQGIVRKLAIRTGWKDKKLEIARNLKIKLYKEIYNNVNPSLEDLKKSFCKIFTKDYLLDLLERNEYSLKKCSIELDGIDPKCIAESIRNFGIEITPEVEQKRRFQPALDSRKKNSSIEFRKFIETYYPEYELLTEYTGYENEVEIRCKKHPDEIIRTSYSNIRYSSLIYDEERNIIGTKPLCKVCRQIEYDKEALKNWIQEIEEKYPGEFDFSNAKLVRVVKSTCAHPIPTIVGIKCNKCGKLFDKAVPCLRESGKCPHCNMSTGEKRTIEALNNLKIQFKYQELMIGVVPVDIRPIGIVVDFLIEDFNGIDIWIEFNGSQHYNSIAKFNISQEEFINNLKRDMYERKYCSERKDKILFIEIPYTFDTVEKIQDLLQRVIIEGENINNIIDYTPFYKEIEELGISIDDESESE